VVLTVSDRGPGFPAETARAGSLGMQLIRALARQLGAKLSFDSDSGDSDSGDSDSGDSDSGDSDSGDRGTGARVTLRMTRIGATRDAA